MPAFQPATHLYHAHLPANHLQTANLLGRPRLRPPATLRHGSRRGHIPPRHLPACARPRAVVCRLCAAQPPPQRRPLRRQPQPPATLLPVPGSPQTRARRYSRPLSRLPARIGHRPQSARHPLCGRRLGKPHPRRMGLGLGSLAQRHGSNPVYLFPAGGRHRLRPRARRNHLRHRTPGHVSARRGKRI